MSLHLQQRIPSRLQRHAQRLGLAGVLGVAMLAGAAWVQWVWLPARQAEAEELASQARRLRYTLRTQAEAGPASRSAQQPAGPAQAWQAVWDSLPWQSQRVALQSEVLAGAASHGLSMRSVQYQGQPERALQAGQQVLWHQSLLMPVEGSYVAVKAWVADLQTRPMLAIDAIDIRRDDVMRDQVKARVVASLYWRQAAEDRP